MEANTEICSICSNGINKTDVKTCRSCRITMGVCCRDFLEVIDLDAPMVIGRKNLIYYDICKKCIVKF